MNEQPRAKRDRNPIALGPAPADARRNASRVQADVDLVNTNIDLGNIGGGGGLTESMVQDLINSYTPVTGGIGTVVGLPVGTPYIYVAPSLTQFPIDISSASLDLAKVAATTQSFCGEVDINNATGMGADSVCMIGSGTGAGAKIIGFDTTAGTVSSLNLLERPTALVRFGTDRLICETPDLTSARLYWIKNGTLQSFSPSSPTTNYRIIGVGPAANGTDVCAVWMLRDTTTGISPYNIHIRTYDTSGVLVSSQTTNAFSYNRLAGNRVRIDNGYIVVYTNVGTVYTKVADTTSTWVGGSGTYTFEQAGLGQVSPSGYAFARSGNDLLRINAATGTTNVYPNTFVNNEGATHGIYSISSTKAVLTGVTATGGDPFVDTIVISGGSSSVTQTVIASTTTSYTMQPVAVPSGDVVFGVEGSDTTTGPYELLVSVNGP